MAYKLEFKKSVEKDLQKLSEKDFLKIEKKIRELQEDPFPSGYKKLMGAKEKIYRVKVGNYRIIYTIIKTKIVLLILLIGQRKDIYKKK